jgi:anti-sigma B factor antagonist
VREFFPTPGHPVPENVVQLAFRRDMHRLTTAGRRRRRASFGHRPNLTVQRRKTTDHLLLHVIGPVDLLTLPILDRQIARALWSVPPTLVIDLTRVEFMSGAGMQLLLDTYDVAPPESRVAVVATAYITRLFALVGITDTLELYPTVDDALSPYRRV